MDEHIELNPAKISVVMCTYNGEKFIEEQLQSLLAQTYPLFEIIVVDDRSTDSTAKIVDEFAAKYPIIKTFVNESNLGFNKNFEKGILLASGDIISICDQDDIWHEEKIEQCIRHWEDASLLCYCDSIKFQGKVPDKIKPEVFIKKIEGNDPKLLAIRNTVSGHAMMFKKELLDLTLPFDKEIYYDWWLAIVAMANGGITYIPKILVYQREHSGNQTLQKNASKKEELKAYKKMLERHLKKFISIPNLTPTDKRFFEQLSGLWQQAMNNKNNFKLFLFLMKYRSMLFKYKQRKMPFISHLKHSLRYSFK